MKSALACGLASLAVLLTGCAGLPGPDLRETNSSNLKRLKLGMTRQEVTEVMGSHTETVQEEVVFELHLASYLALEVSNPYSTELLKNDRDDFEILYYYAEIGGMRMGFWDRSYSERKVPERFLTPVVLRNGSVIGWGWEILEEEGLKEPAAVTQQDDSLLCGS